MQFLQMAKKKNSDKRTKKKCSQVFMANAIHVFGTFYAYLNVRTERNGKWNFKLTSEFWNCVTMNSANHKLCRMFRKP